MTASKSVLITGATGFVGSHLVSRNLSEGNRVRAFVRPGNPQAAELDERGVEIAWGDLTDRQSIEKAVTGCEIVFHSAATVTDWAPRKVFDQVNIQGTEKVCQACLASGVKRLVYVSTCDVFGLQEGVVIDEAHGYHPWREPYPDTKAKASELAMGYNHKGLPVTIIYPCWVYGPGDRTFLPLVADTIVKRQMVYFRKGAMLWLSYVDNVVDLAMLLAEHPRAIGEGFLVHDGGYLTLEQISDRIADTLGVRRIKKRVPFWLALSAAWLVEKIAKLRRKKLRPLMTTYVIKNMGSRLQYSTEKVQKVLGWTPPVALEQGLEISLNWLKTLDLDKLKGK